MVGSVDWTNVLDTFIGAIPAIITAMIAALYAAKAHKKVNAVQDELQLPSGKPIGEAMEYTHDTAIANNLLLSKSNGATKSANHDMIVAEAPEHPQIPADSHE